MSIEQLIHELILARAKLAHVESGNRATWDALTDCERERFMSVARRSVEPVLLREAEKP